MESKLSNATYNWKAVPEASWYALGTTIGAIAGAIALALGANEYAASAITAAFAPLPRIVVGLLLPFPPTTGTDADKSS